VLGSRQMPETGRAGHPGNPPGARSVKRVGEHERLEVTEAQLVDAARAGDQRAMGALYSAHAGRVYSVVRRVVGDDHLAEDVSQDAWVRAFQKLHLFRGDAAFGTWMHRLAVNAAVNQLRSLGRRSKLESSPDLKLPVQQPDESGLNHRILSTALDQLPEGYRTVIVLHDVEGLTHEEIGQKLDIAAGTSKSQLHKARARMRALLDPQLRPNEVGNHG
jgi:RNA polymerase sigma-70 factor, ECF subfamily